MPTYNLLRSKRPIVADPDLATNIGLNEAIILQKFNFLIDLNQEKQNPRSYHEGKWWTFNSYKTWHEKYFYWWSERTVRRTINSLKKQKIIESNNFNKAGFDKTQWYTINYDNPKLYKVVDRRCGQSGQTNRTKRTDGYGQNGQTNTIEDPYKTTIEDNQTVTGNSTVKKSSKESQSPNNSNRSFDSFFDNLNNESNNNDIHKALAFYQNNIGTISPFQAEQLQAYSNDFSSDMIIEAMKVALNKNIRSIKFIKGVLNTWHKKNVHTLDEKKADDLEHKKQYSNNPINTKDNTNGGIIDHGNGDIEF